jgi:hypothetical protein
MMHSEHKERLELVRRTHEIYCGIKGKDITLITTDPPGKTDCETYIGLPMEDPDVHLIHKHEWQHIFFKTNLRAREAFVAKYVESLNGRMGGNTNMDELERFIHLLANALDDIRCCSLWELIYPYSADEIVQRWRRMLRGYHNKQDFISFVMATALGVPFATNWEMLRPEIEKAVGMVRRTGYGAVLLATRLLLEDILRKSTVRPTSPSPTPTRRQMPTHEEQLASQSRVLNSLEAKRTAFGFNDTPKPPSSPDPDPQATNKMVQTALSVSQDHQIQVMLERGATEVEAVLTALRTQSSRLTTDDRLVQGMPVSVRFKDLKKSDLEPTILEPQDTKVINYLRAKFSRFMDRRETKISEGGSTLNTTAYIDYLLGSGEPEFFDDDVSSRGFSGLILIDMSGSMRALWSAVCRAGKVVAKATKFPFSDVEVWGFSSNQKGEVILFRFEDVEWGYYGPGVRPHEAWGLTPLHVAVPVASRKLETMVGSKKHLFVITDGNPMYMWKNRQVSTQSQLIPEVAKHVRNARSRNVNVGALVVGNEITDNNADTLFGGRRYWTRVRSEKQDLFREMVSLVDGAFTSFLKSR